MINADGSSNYTPNAGLVGRDWFTWQVVDGSKLGEYATVFIDVQPVTLSISVGSLKQGDPTAQIPNIQFPPDANGDPQYATINLGFPGDLPTGSTVTLSVNSDVQNDLDVYDGVPGDSGTNLLFGKDAGISTYTWTVSDSQQPPSTVYAVGLAGTDYDQVMFTLAVSAGQQTVGTPPGNQPAAAPADGPAVANTQPSTVPAKHGRLEALDGTQDVGSDDTSVFLLSSRHYQGSPDYVRGVANRKDHMHLLGRMFLLDLGDAEALKLEREAMDNVQTFYNQDVTHQAIPLDVVGYSRGAMEAVKLVNDLSSIGVPNIFKPKQTINGKEQFPPFHPAVRFVGLISPVMGPNEVAGLWPRSLPAGVGYLYQALDNFPLDPFLPQHTITKAATTLGPAPQTFPLGHIGIGHDPGVLATLISEARAAGAPVT